MRCAGCCLLQNQRRLLHNLLVPRRLHASICQNQQSKAPVVERRSGKMFPIMSDLPGIQGECRTHTARWTNMQRMIRAHVAQGMASPSWKAGPQYAVSTPIFQAITSKEISNLQERMSCVKRSNVEAQTECDSYLTAAGHRITIDERA